MQYIVAVSTASFLFSGYECEQQHGKSWLLISYQTLSIYQVTTDFIMYFVNTVQKSRCHAYCKKFLFVLMDTSIIIQIFVIMPKKKEKGIEHFFDIWRKQEYLRSFRCYLLWYLVSLESGIKDAMNLVSNFQVILALVSQICQCVGGCFATSTLVSDTWWATRQAHAMLEKTAW